MRKYRAETTDSDLDDEPTDSHTAIHVESVEGDVDLSVTLGDAQKEQSNESVIARPPKGDDSNPPESDHEDADETCSDANVTEKDSAE